ncbi:uncharacterized protein LOC123257156 [Drosophila ananassae]|uniref:uncharacterized protein LOC123257156 n=1 Tax=Drosophila ananassae TaxID=7217 RepID=UPI000177C44D|nr:uncharacterized protein LOC123257156 [Drosophila ananassae]
MKYLFVVALIVLAIQLAAATSTNSTSSNTTTATTTTTDATTTTTTDATTTTEAHRKKLCWRGNDWCGTFIPRRRCRNGHRCHRVRVTRRRTA